MIRYWVVTGHDVRGMHMASYPAAVGGSFDSCQDYTHNRKDEAANWAPSSLQSPSSESLYNLMSSSLNHSHDELLQHE